MSCPYLLTTYFNTDSLPSSSKSISISGIEIRSRFRKRSNRSPYFMGSISVILRQYATADPAAEPLPGPTETPISLAARRKSWTIRKYPGNPILAIISSSKSRRSVCSFVSVPHLSFAPLYVRNLRYSSLSV